MANAEIVYKFKGVDAGASSTFDVIATCCDRISAALRDCATSLRDLAVEPDQDEQTG